MVKANPLHKKQHLKINFTVRHYYRVVEMFQNFLNVWYTIRCVRSFFVPVKYDIMPKELFIYLKQHGECSFINFNEILKYFSNLKHVESVVRKLLALMKLVISCKNNPCIPQTTSKILFCYCSLFVEIFQQFKHI